MPVYPGRVGGTAPGMTERPANTTPGIADLTAAFMTPSGLERRAPAGLDQLLADIGYRNFGDDHNREYRELARAGIRATTYERAGRAGRRGIISASERERNP